MKQGFLRITALLLLVVMLALPLASCANRGTPMLSLTVDGKTYNGVANVGMRPTVDGKQARVNCETHLFDYTGDLYGKVLCTAFYTYLRPERKFESADALRAAIASDAQRARAYFENFT